MADQFISKFGAIPVEDNASTGFVSKFGAIPVSGGEPPKSRFASSAIPGTEQLGSPPPAPKPPLPNELKPEDQQDDSFWTSPHGLIRSGIRQAVHGVEAGSAPGLDPKLGAASEVIRGLGKAALPAAIPLAVANPVGAAGALAGGVIGGKATGMAAHALGAQPGAQALAEDVGSALGGGAGAKGGSALARGAKQSLNLRPDVAVEKIWRPSPADSDFPQVTPDALADVKTYGNPRVRTNAETKVATEQAIQTLQQHLDQWLTEARVRGTRVSGNSIVQATAKAIPETMWREDPTGAQALIDQAQRAYGGKQFTTDQFRQYLKEKNAGSAGFYGKSGARQQAGVTSGTPEALEKVQGDAIREALYQALDPENGGAGPREIQTRTGRLYDLRNAADRRMNAITGEKSVSTASTAGKMGAGIINIPGKLLHGDFEGAVRPFVERGMGTSDPMIERLFQQVGDAPPIPRPPGVIRNLNPNRALGPGGVSPIAAGPITPDASFVRSAPLAPHEQVNRMRRAIGQSPLPNPPGGPHEVGQVRVGQDLPDVQMEDTSFARGVNAPLNPATGQPWTVEEIKSYLAALPKYAKGGIIKKPTLLSDLKTGKPTGIMAEAGPEEIRPIAKPDLSTELNELSARSRRAVRIPSGTFPRSIPDGMATHVDSTSGDKIVFNPSLIGIHDIKSAVAMKRLTPLLGRTHSPSAMSSVKHIMKQSRRAVNRISK